MCPPGGVARIQRANADEFIHIFVNNSQKLTEFLEHMVKVSSLAAVCSPLPMFNLLQLHFVSNYL